MYRLVLLHMWPPILFSDFSETQCQMGTCIYSIQFEWRHIIVFTPVKDEFHKFFLKQIFFSFCHNIIFGMAKILFPFIPNHNIRYSQFTILTDTLQKTSRFLQLFYSEKCYFCNRIC